MSGIDALVMGRNTFDTVCSFEIDWPYQKPVFVLSNSLTSVPEEYKAKVTLLKGTLTEILEQIHTQNCHSLYIDGGRTIQRFLQDDLIDEMTITIIPILLGGGTPLFTDLPQTLDFECVASELYLGKIVQNRFVRKRD